MLARRALLSMTALLLLSAGVSAQIPGVRLPKPGGVKIPGLEKGLDAFLKEPAPVTTSLDDAVTEVPSLDDFDPKDVLPMIDLPRTPDGGYWLAPGVWEMTVRSFCLKAGTHGPSQGSGHSYAPLKGPKANVVRNILLSSANHPEIPQQDVQVLLWAIIARTKFTDMPRRHQETAARLLSPKDLLDLNGGALGVLAPDAQEKAFANLPGPVKQVLEAENNLRKMMTSTVEAPYNELERVAVLTGLPIIEPGGREIKRGRWSYHPDGYFIRFFANSYQATKIQIYFPEKFEVKQDRNGRIERAIIGAAEPMLTEDPVRVALGDGTLLPGMRPTVRRHFAGGLKPFNPSGGLAVPPGSGQRLGQSPAPSNPPRVNPNTLKQITKLTPKGPVGMIPGGGPLGMAAGGLGMGIPRALFQKILDFNIDTWSAASDALGGGTGGGGNGDGGSLLGDLGNYASLCAVADFREIARPVAVTLDKYPVGNGVSAAQAQVIDNVLASSSDLTQKIRALQVSQQRQKEATKAGDVNWSRQQAQAVVYYKRETGLALQKTAADLRALAKMLEDAGAGGIQVTPENVRKYQGDLQSKGFDADDLKAAKTLNLTNAEIDAAKANRLSARPEDLGGTLVAKYRALADSLDGMAKPFAAFPEVPAP
jgi:hypothetical protein